MSIDLIQEIAKKLESLQQIPQKKNPLQSQLPPGFPPIGAYAPNKTKDTRNAAIQICAVVENILSKKTWINEKNWERALMNTKNQVGAYASKCGLRCSETEAEDIVKTICANKGIPFPPKFEDGK